MIRSATASDIPDLIRLGEEMRLESRTYFPPIEPDWVHAMAAEWLKQPEVYCIFVAEKDGEVIGFLTGFCGPVSFSRQKKASTDLLFVSKQARSLRVVLGLLQVFESWAREREAKSTFVGVSTGADLSKLMTRLGFEEAGAIYARTV